MAAEYLGVSASTFDAEVRSGLWPAPQRRGAKGGRLTWDRHLIDAWADRLSGIAASAGPVEADVGEAAALELASRGTTSANRTKHRHPKAA
jgi:predicted DNA-binding transcriptional regulator AlpA